MDAREEARDLVQNPLPPVVIVDPLTLVYELDGYIAGLQEQINALVEQRTQALDYAVKNNIAEDGRCKLETKTKRFRTLDVIRFREVFPEEFMTVCDVECRDLEEKMQHLGEKIPITLVDKIMKKARLEAAQGVVTVKESISYSVVPR